MHNVSIRVPNALLPAINNADYAGLNDSEIACLNRVLVERGVAFKDPRSVEPRGFTAHHDIPVMGLRNCSTVTWTMGDE